MTYGDMKMRFTQMFPSISLDLIEGWIGDRYAEVLGELPWSRLNAQAVLSTTAPYATGTVTLTLGSNAVTGLGTTWVTGMSGLAFRVTGRDEFYQFTYLSGTTGTLDRTYAGPSAAGAGYSISQSVYVLPADCRMLDDNAFQPLTRTTHAQLDQSDPLRKLNGKPAFWLSYMDDNSTPPRMQVAVWPNPDALYSLPFTYAADAGDLASTTTALQVWIQPAALIEGVTARIKAHLKDYNGAQFHTVLAKAALGNMRTSEAQGMAPAQMALDSYYTAHRRRRCR